MARSGAGDAFPGQELANGVVTGRETETTLQYRSGSSRPPQRPPPGVKHARRLFYYSINANFISVHRVIAHFHMFPSDSGGRRQRRRPFCENGANLHTDSGETGRANNNNICLTLNLPRALGRCKRRREEKEFGKVGLKKRSH